jgi:hypothetical protein
MTNEDNFGAIGGMNVWQGKLKYSEKIRFSAQLSNKFRMTHADEVGTWQISA